jgi:hypothetical protein
MFFAASPAALLISKNTARRRVMESWSLVPFIFENSSQNVSLCALLKCIQHLLMLRRYILSDDMKFKKARHL